MSVLENALSLAERSAIKQELLASNDVFVAALPKVELHVHIEGTLTPSLRWKLAQRNGMTLGLKRTGTVYHSVEQLEASYTLIQSRPGHTFNDAEERFTFFEAYYTGFEVLVTARDFYDLAMNYFEHAAAMNVRYCVPFFDPQGHTRRGVAWDTMMAGLREAQVEAETRLNASLFATCVDAVCLFVDIITSCRSSPSGPCASCATCRQSLQWNTSKPRCHTAT